MVHVIVPLMLLDALLTKLCSGEFRSKLSLSNWVLFIHMANFKLVVTIRFDQLAIHDNQL